jgi:hypothetical protein
VLGIAEQRTASDSVVKLGRASGDAHWLLQLAAAASMFSERFYLPCRQPNVIGIKTTDRSYKAR